MVASRFIAILMVGVLFSELAAVAQITNVGAWGLNGSGETDIPEGLGPVMRVSAGGGHSLALLTNGQVAAWGRNTAGQCNVPAGATNLSAIAAGGLFSVAMRTNGTLVAWGGTNTSSHSVPVGFGSALALAAGSYGHGVAAYSSGFVRSWGYSGNGTASSSISLANVKALAAGYYHNVALLNDGTIRSWWASTSLISPSFGAITNVPSGLSNVIAIAAGDAHTLALRSNGTVVAWGMNDAGQTDVPMNLTNIIGITAGGSQSLAITADGKIVTWGGPLLDSATFNPRIAPSDLTNVVGASASAAHVLVMTTNPTPCVTQSPRSRSAPVGWPVTFRTASTGRTPLRYQWQFNGTDIPDQTNSSLTISNVQPSHYGDYQVVVTNAFGASTSAVANLAPGNLLAWGQNTSEQCWFHPGFSNVTSLAAGVGATLGMKADGRLAVAGWVSGASDAASFQAIADASALAAGTHGQLVIRSNGTVVALDGLGFYPVPPAATNVIEGAVGRMGDTAVVLRNDGRLVGWTNSPSAITNIPTWFTNGVAVAAGYDFGYALTDGGLLVGFGNSASAVVPQNLQDVVACMISRAPGGGTRYALRADGSVVTWNNAGVISNVSGGTNCVAMAAGSGHLLLLHSDGTVTVTGSNQNGQATPPGSLSNVVEVAAGDLHSIVRFGDGSPRITVSPYSRSVHAGSNSTLTAFGVGAPPLSYQWQLNGTNISDATNANFVLSNAGLATVGGYCCIITNAFGAVTSAVANVAVVFDPPRFNLLNPPPALAPDGFGVRVEGLSGAGPTIVYASTNLLDWQPILTNPPGPVHFDFLDPAATNQPLRFYKVSEQR